MSTVVLYQYAPGKFHTSHVCICFVAFVKMEDFCQSGNIAQVFLSIRRSHLRRCVHDLMQCHSCRKPYFGGLVSCEPAAPLGGGGWNGAGAAGGAGGRGGGEVSGGAAEAAAAERARADVKPQELLCGKCSAGSGGADCSEHGQVCSCCSRRSCRRSTRSVDNARETSVLGRVQFCAGVLRYLWPEVCASCLGRDRWCQKVRHFFFSFLCFRTRVFVALLR